MQLPHFSLCGSVHLDLSSGGRTDRQCPISPPPPSAEAHGPAQALSILAASRCEGAHTFSRSRVSLGRGARLVTRRALGAAAGCSSAAGCTSCAPSGLRCVRGGREAGSGAMAIFCRCRALGGPRPHQASSRLGGLFRRPSMRSSGAIASSRATERNSSRHGGANSPAHAVLVGERVLVVVALIHHVVQVAARARLDARHRCRATVRWGMPLGTMGREAGCRSCVQ